MERMTSEELYKKRREPITKEEKEKMIDDSRALMNDELERSGDKVPEEFVPNGIKRNNEKIIRDDHEIK